MTPSPKRKRETTMWYMKKRPSEMASMYRSLNFIRQVDKDPLGDPDRITNWMAKRSMGA